MPTPSDFIFFKEGSALDSTTQWEGGEESGYKLRGGPTGHNSSSVWGKHGRLQTARKPEQADNTQKVVKFGRTRENLTVHLRIERQG